MRHLQLHLAVLAVSLPLSSCTDNREQITHAALYKTDGSFDDAALSAAFPAKFHNKPPDAMKDFATSLKGECVQLKDNVLHCEVNVSGTVCAVYSLIIDGSINNGVINSAKAVAMWKYC